MGYILMWIESLAASALLVAAAVSFHEQTQRRWLRRLLFWAALSIPLLIGIAETGGSIVLIYALIENNWLIYTLSWTVAFIVVAGWISVRGLKRSGEQPSAAAAWPVKALALGFLAALAVHLITFWNLDSSMRLRLTSIRMEAGAIALGAAPPRVPDQENAAFIYEKCFESVAQLQEAHKEVGTKLGAGNLNKADFGTADAGLREYLRLLQPTIRQLHRAAAMRGCFFEHDYGQPSMDMLLPELSHMRNLARILAADARVKAADGKIRDALEDIAVIRKMGHDVTTEPILISGLVAVAINEIASDALEGILSASTPQAADLAAIPMDDNFSFRRALTRCMSGEEAFGMSTFAMLGGDPGSDDIMRYVGINPETVGPVFGPIWRVFLLSDDFNSYRAQMKTVRQLTQQKFSEAIASLDAMDTQFKQRRAGIMSGLMMPMLSRAFRAFIRAEARHRLSNLAVAVAAYRAKNGKFPAQIQDVSPEFIGEIPLDPFDNKPMRMISSAGTITLYSIGEDMTDGGGTTHDFEKGDILFRIGAPAPAKAGSL